MSYEITYNGVTIGDVNLDIVGFDGVSGVPIRIYEQELTGLDGSKIYNRLRGPRTIRISGVIEYNDLSTYYSQRSVVLDAFDIDATDETLAITRSDGVQRSIEAKVVRMPDFVEVVGEYAYTEYTVELRAEAPNTFTDGSVITETVTLADIVGYDTGYDTGYGSTSTGGNEVTITNAGDVASRLKQVIFYANSDTLQNPRLTNLTTGEFFEINTTITIDNYVRILFDQEGIYIFLNDATNYYQYFLGNYFFLNKGANTLAFTAQVFSSVAECEIQFENKYKTI